MSNTTMPQDDANKQGKRKAPSSIPDGLNGRSLEWSQHQFTLREFLDIYSYKLPTIVSVRNGYMGKDELHTFSTNEVYLISAVKTQRRIVAREGGGYYVSIPVDYPMYVTVYPKDGKVRLVSLSEVADMKGRCRDEFCIIFENDKLVNFSLGADEGTKASLGVLTVTDVYDEHYFIGYPLAQGEVSLLYMVTIPAYVTISVAVASNIKGESKDVFVTLMSNLKKAIDCVSMNYNINHEIILFPKNITSNDYEYIDPASIVRSTPVRKPTTLPAGRAEKENPYVSLPHSKQNVKQGIKPHNPSHGPPSGRHKPPMLTKPATLSSASKVRSGQATVQGQVQSHKTLPNRVGTTSRPVLGQADIFAAAGSEAARKVAMKQTKQTDGAPPASSAETEYCSLTTSPKDVKDMTVDEITNWMRRMNMSQYTDVIVKNDVNGVLLKSLDEDILTNEFGLSRFYAIKLLKFANAGYRPT